MHRAGRAQRGRTEHCPLDAYPRREGRPAAAKGDRIDPRRTLTVATGADLHLQLKPGTNVAMLNGICHLLIENGWIDRDFIDRYTVKFDQFRAMVARYTPDRVESICGVPSTMLRQ